MKYLLDTHSLKRIPEIWLRNLVEIREGGQSKFQKLRH